MDEAQLRQLASYTASFGDAEMETFVKLASEGSSDAEIQRRVARVREIRSSKKSSLWPVLLLVGALAASLLLVVSHEDPPVVTLEQSLFRTVIGGVDPEKDWVVFFYKPYCGACRRVRPVFHALAKTTNTTRLKFGEIDCVKWRPLCHHAGAKAQPVIKLYRSAGKSRREVASWQGMLIAYEVLDWFYSLKQQDLIHADFAEPDVIADEMRRFKVSGPPVETLTSDPKASVDAALVAFRMGLHDAVFQRGPLSGDRLIAMLEWLDACGFALPVKTWRARADALRDNLAKQPSWSLNAFYKLLKKHDVVEPTQREWEQLGHCAPVASASSSGVGGYPCSLWTLFHTLLANSDRHAAPHVLAAVRAFVVNFFGCTECADHFDKMWHDDHGTDAHDAFDANLWLWRAHNQVSRRLAHEDPLNRPFKKEWPDNATCTPCFKANHHPQGATLTPLPDEDPYDDGYVFQFLSETYCFNSDSFVCAAFDGPASASKTPTPSSRRRTPLNGRDEEF